MPPEVSIQRQSIDVDDLPNMPAGIWHLHVAPMLEIKRGHWQHVCKAPWVNQPQNTQQVYNNCNIDKIKIKMRLESI